MAKEKLGAEENFLEVILQLGWDGEPSHHDRSPLWGGTFTQKGRNFKGGVWVLVLCFRERGKPAYPFVSSSSLSQPSCPSPPTGHLQFQDWWRWCLRQRPQWHWPLHMQSVECQWFLGRPGLPGMHGALLGPQLLKYASPCMMFVNNLAARHPATSKGKGALSPGNCLLHPYKTHTGVD